MHEKSGHHPENSVNTGAQYTLLTLGNRSILVEQCDVIAIENYRDIDTAEPLDMSLGWQNYRGSRIPVYSLSDELELMNEFSGNRAVCAVMNSGSRYISLVCSGALGFNYYIDKKVSLPECMQTHPSPIESICLSTSGSAPKINLIASSGSLIDYIERYSEASI